MHLNMDSCGCSVNDIHEHVQWAMINELFMLCLSLCGGVESDRVTSSKSPLVNIVCLCVADVRLIAGEY